MINTAQNSVSSDQYEGLKAQAIFQMRELYHHESIAIDITNLILLSLVEEANLPLNPESWMSRMVSLHSEKYFNDLWQYCYRYALQLTKQPETAEDIVQASLGALFQSPKQVLYIRGWLKTTIYHNVVTLSKQNAKSSKLLQDVKEISEHGYYHVCGDEDKAVKSLDTAQIRKLLNPQDYRLYSKYNKYPNLKLYASSEGISYQTAREHKHRVKTNLKAAYLRQQGWEGSPEILDFRQLINLKKFMKALTTHAINGDLEKMKKYCPRDKQQLVVDTLQDLRSVTDWGINLRGANKYVLTIFDASSKGLPNFYSVDIHLNRANQIRISACKKLEMMGMINTVDAGQIPIEKGKCTLSILEMIEILKRPGGQFFDRRKHKRD